MLARLLRAAIIAVPLVAGIGAGLVVSGLIPRPAGPLSLAGWWLLVLLVSAAVLAIVDRLGRRLLPLAALLHLSLLFPDRAPSRFAVALRAGSTRRLADRLLDVERAAAAQPMATAESLLALVGALTLHDRPSRGHSERVRAFTDLIAEEMGLSELDRERLRWASLLHDIGKLTVSPDVLNKPARLDEVEWAQVRRHPAEGARLIEPLRGFLGDWVGAVGQHHERWDGSGYPLGLAGEQIGLAARIVSVADAFEVMTGVRSYRRPLRPEAARAELVANNASQFDPAVVRAFLNVSLGRLQRVLTPVAWLVQVPFIAATTGTDHALAAADDGSAFDQVVAALHPAAALHPGAAPHPVLGHHPAWDGGGAAGGESGDDHDALGDAMAAEEQR